MLEHLAVVANRKNGDGDNRTYRTKNKKLALLFRQLIISHFLTPYAVRKIDDRIIFDRWLEPFRVLEKSFIYYQLIDKSQNKAIDI
jgi:hypothetical protein